MKAVRFNSTGEPADVLNVEETDVPTPGPGELRVRMLASPINPADLMFIRGIYGKKPSLPATPGFEGVGIVEAGNGPLARFLMGKQVAVLNRDRGNWCEQTIVNARQAIPLGRGLTVEQGATFFVNPATAWVMTQEVLRVPRGAWLMQTAAGSALGRMVIRLGHECGFKTLAVVRREEQIDELRELGADQVLAHHDATPPDSLAEKVREIVPGGVRYIIDPVGGGTGSAAVGCLGRGGRMLVYGTLSDEPLTFSSRTLMTNAATVEGFWLSNYMASQKLLAKLKLVRTIRRLIVSGVLTSHIGQSFQLDEVQEAVRAAERPARDGKVLLRIGE